MAPFIFVSFLFSWRLLRTRRIRAVDRIESYVALILFVLVPKNDNTCDEGKEGGKSSYTNHNRLFLKATK